MDRSVKLLGPRDQCSGVQIHAPSGKDYILSAAHCVKVAGAERIFYVELEDKTHVNKKIVVEDPNSDLLLIEGLDAKEGLRISREVKQGQHIRTYTHGHGMDTYMTEGRLLAERNITIALGLVGSDEVGACTDPKYRITYTDVLGAGIGMPLCLLKVKEAVTNAPVLPGSSGGMVVDDQGDIVGIVSAKEDMLSWIVTLKDIKAFLKDR